MVLKNLRADKFFLGVDAVSIEHGVSNIVLEEVPINQLMITNSAEVIMVSDGSKFGRNAPIGCPRWMQSIRSSPIIALIGLSRFP